MGCFAIVIVGTGVHHNADNPKDADKMAHQFCNKLREAGHSIESAEFQLIGPNQPEALLEGVATTGLFQEPTPTAADPVPAAESSEASSPETAGDAAA